MTATCVLATVHQLARDARRIFLLFIILKIHYTQPLKYILFRHSPIYMRDD
jgi:hypothetical protein